MTTKTQYSASFYERKRNANDKWANSARKKTKTSLNNANLPRNNAKIDGDFVLLKNGRERIDIGVRDRRERMDLIPACVPDSVGLEIENILHNSFNNRNYLEDEKQASKRGLPSKKKSPRSLSTEDLPPNLLPEDYLDEVISQYFNKDDKPSDDNLVARESHEHSDNSSNEEDEDHTEDDDDHNTKPSKSKIKTDEEIELEYKHIIFGAKKRKGPRLGLISPRKKKKSPKEKHKKKTSSRNDKSPIKSERRKTLSFDDLESKYKLEKLSTMHPEPLPAKKPVLNKSSNKVNPDLTETLSVQKWSGKRASKKAFDRSRMIQSGKRLFTSSKIEDVTGKYGQEEELVTCAICSMMDPPVDPENPLTSAETTEWVGCDCYRWYHKSCTKLTKFTEKFSCKSVRRKCQDAAAPAPAAVTAVLQVAILKFFRDRDVCFIEDVLW